MSVVGVRVLLVEDDAVIGESLLLHLERHDYDATWVQDGLDAWHAFEEPDGSGEFDVVVSDVLLPGIDGVTLCRRIRDAGNTPVVLISARDDALDVIGGLEAGADDYVTKPFEVQVLLARLRSVVRRSRAAAPAPTGPDSVGTLEHFGDVELDRSALRVTRAGERISLTPTELRLLLELAEEPGRLVSHEQLLERVWDLPDSDDTRLVTVHVQRLRAKVGAERIETVRGFGYKLVP